MKLQAVLDGEINLPTPFFWRYGRNKVRITRFTDTYIWFENKSGVRFRKFRFHCGFTFNEIESA